MFHGICIIGSLTPLYNVHDLWIDVLGRDLVNDTASKRILRKFISTYISTSRTAHF